MKDPVLKFVCKECEKNGIPLFLEMGDGYDVECVLSNQVLSHANWTVQTPQSLFRIESALTNKDNLPSWERLGRRFMIRINCLVKASYTTPQSILDVLYSPCMRVLDEMKRNSPNAVGNKSAIFARFAHE